MAGAEGIEGGREVEEVGCGCGGVGLLPLWLATGVWTGCLLLQLLLLLRRKGVDQTFLTLDSTSTDCIQDVGFVS